MDKIRKAIVAGIGAGITAGLGSVSSVLQDGKFDAGDFGIVLGAFVVAAATVGYATYKIPNAES